MSNPTAPPKDEPITTLSAHKLHQNRKPGERHLSAFTVTYLCAGQRFEILVTDDPPPGYDRDGAVETGWARTTEDVCFHGIHGTRNEDRHREFLDEIAEIIKEIVRPVVLRMVREGPGVETGTGSVKLQLVTEKGVQVVTPGHYLSTNTGTASTGTDEG
ncbi:hypothetical protein QBC34DRAFT_405876 [Podospora aff. communis PSN243]|uniref:Uncharacterized protein n=1 Tax=Podospora aff. communis PSN243 TaxID=3040156 RepID=A0AAV9GLH5_9PEZI|nr:hypothetical protein QBC34DRAFT_405876 [Podospora aff. communis PSN243]